MITARFRWRLMLAFVLVAAVASGAVAVGSYLLVRRDRLSSFEERARSTTDLTVSFLAGGAGPSEQLEDVIARLGRHRSFDVVLIRSGSFAATDQKIEPADIPGELTDDASDLRTAVVALGGENQFLVAPGGSVAGARIVFMFHRGNLDAQLQGLAANLLRAWTAVTLLGALVGNLVARATLRPVARASAAARSLAEGLLDTRLPEDRTDEFGQWAGSFNRMAAELEKKIEELTRSRDRERRFTADVAHELRTPLTSLVSAASMLRAELQSLAPEARWAAERLLEQVVRMRNLVQELLELCRLDAGEEDLLLEELDLAAYLTRLIDVRGWSAKVDVQGDAGAVVSDRRRLDRILANLIDNAVKHGDGRAEVYLHSTNDECEVTVRDHGSGISPEDLHRIFDRFFKSDGSLGGGSGLGLAIAQENARLLGGRIVAHSSEGSGSAFTLHLPSDPRGSSEASRPPSKTPEHV